VERTNRGFFFTRSSESSRAERADPWGRRGERRTEAKLESRSRRSLPHWGLEPGDSPRREGWVGLGWHGCGCGRAGSRCREQPLEEKKGHSSPVQFSRVVLAGSAAARARSEPERTVATSVTDRSPPVGGKMQQPGRPVTVRKRPAGVPPGAVMTRAHGHERQACVHADVASGSGPRAFSSRATERGC